MPLQFLELEVNMNAGLSRDSRKPSGSRRAVLVALLSVSVLGSFFIASAKDSATNPRDKGILSFAWDAVKPSWLKDNPKALESSVFSAFIVRPEAARNVFTRAPYPTAGFDKDRDNLLALPKGALENSFLEIQSTPGTYSGRPDADHGFDWFSDADWRSAEQNVENFARVVAATGMRGIFFDNEPYFGSRPWGFEYQPNRDSRTFAAYETQLRSRGSQFMRALERHAPGLTVFSTRFLTSTYREWTQGASFEEIRVGLPKQHFYGLWPAFFEGMLEAASEKVRFVDGAEGTYYHYSSTQFDTTKRWVLEESPVLLKSENRAKYKRLIRLSSAVYLDGLMNTANDPRFLGYYVTSDADRLKLLEHNVYHSLRIADEYAWVFSETTKWWSGKPSDALVNAVRSARDKLRSGQGLGFDSSFAAAAGKRFEARVNFAGFVRDAAGKGMADIEILTSGAGIRCKNTEANGVYTCVSISGWSGEIRPKLEGFGLTPAVRSYTAVTKDQFGQNFTAVRQP
jgi:hypothetical protein